ncbi:hypothetical protein KGY79_05170 [Candidatus Bipolaricaulota bacterium]|nr:hypothetical protein [Candidatus Bipolaricaulota bacterium]
MNNWLNDINDSFYESLKEFIEENKEKIDSEDISSEIEEFVEKSTSAASEVLQKELNKNAHNMLREHRYEEEGFKSRLHMRWYPAFDLLRSLIVLSEEAGRDFNPRESEGLSDDEKNIAEALTRIHIRAVRCAREIFCLLRGGFSDGAFARWRTLHELAISALFIKKHGGELAQKYMDYSTIETYYEIKKYREHNEKLGYEEIEDNTIAEIEQKKQDLEEKYGQNFSRINGWAAETLNQDSVKIVDLEKDVELDHLRPFYNLACQNVHASPKRLFFNIGIYGNKNQQMLLSGPSNYGLALPGQNTGISLAQVSTTLMAVHPTPARIIITGAINQFMQEVSEKFVQIQQQIEEEEQRG